jgi:endonuclease/exonuclease/phosphatase (EEP) superfamily protein YafD
MLRAELPWQNRVISLYGVHLFAPLSNHWTGARNKQLIELASLVAGNHNPDKIVFGDFNQTPLSPHFQHFIKSSGLHIMHSGLGSLASWPAPLGAFGISLDHILSSDTFNALYRTRGPYIGSDHYPIIIELY